MERVVLFLHWIHSYTAKVAHIQLTELHQRQIIIFHSTRTVSINILDWILRVDASRFVIIIRIFSNKRSIACLFTQMQNIFMTIKNIGVATSVTKVSLNK
jgi:hypothetical protein